jgi:hypothetical protein
MRLRANSARTLSQALASLALSIARAKPALTGVLLARLKRLAISEAADEPGFRVFSARAVFIYGPL